MNQTSNQLLQNNSWTSSLCSGLRQGLRYTLPALAIGIRVATIALPFLILSQIPAAAADSQTNLCALERAPSEQETALALPLLVPGLMNATATLGLLALDRERWINARDVSCMQEDLTCYGQARQSKIDLNERDHCTPCKPAAGKNMPTLTERSIELEALPTIRESANFNDIFSGSILIVARQNGLASLGIRMGQAYLDPKNKWANATHAAIIEDVKDELSAGALEVPNFHIPLSNTLYRIQNLPSGEEWMIFNPGLLLQKPENKTFLNHFLAISKTFVQAAKRIQIEKAPYDFTGIAKLPLESHDRFQPDDWIHLLDRLLEYSILLADENQVYAPQNTQYFCSKFVWECVQLARLVQAHPDLYKRIERLREEIDILHPDKRQEALEALYLEFQDTLAKNADEPLFAFSSRFATPAKLIAFAQSHNLPLTRISNPNGTIPQSNLGEALNWIGTRLFKEGLSCALEKPVEEILNELEKKIRRGEPTPKDDPEIQCFIEHFSSQTTYSKETLQCMLWECLVDAPEMSADCPETCLEKTLTWREKITLGFTSIAIDRTLDRLIQTGQLERVLDEAVFNHQFPEELTVAALTDHLFASEHLGFYDAFASPGKVLSSAENYMIRQYVRYFLSDADVYKHFPLGLLGSKTVFEKIGRDYTPPAKKLGDFIQAYLQKKVKEVSTSVLP